MLLTLFIKGGPLMWPLLLTSMISIGVVFERMIFLGREKRLRDPKAVAMILTHTEKGQIEAGLAAGKDSKDYVARSLVYALSHQADSFSNALLLAASKELRRYGQGLSTLDTIITLAPLLGLLGTVTGMIHAFGLLGGQGLEAQTVITGGISEALIATAFGLFIAIVSLIPYNYLNKCQEEARSDMEEAATLLELLLIKADKP